MPDLDPGAEEYRTLREEKSADWRLITQVALTTLATSAAIAVGALAAHSRVLVAVAPIPFYIGVLYLIHSAWLQNRMNAFIASRAPEGALNYELHVAQARESDSGAPRARWAISYYWWIGVAAVLGVLFSLFPFVVSWEKPSGFETDCPGAIAGIGAAFLGGFLILAVWLVRKTEADRLKWVDYWTEGRGAPRDRSSHQDPQPPAT